MKRSEIKYSKKYIEIKIDEREAKEILTDLKHLELYYDLEVSTTWLKKYLEEIVKN